MPQPSPVGLGNHGLEHCAHTVISPIETERREKRAVPWRPPRMGTMGIDKQCPITLAPPSSHHSPMVPLAIKPHPRAPIPCHWPGAPPLSTHSSPSLHYLLIQCSCNNHGPLPHTATIGAILSFWTGLRAPFQDQENRFLSGESHNNTYGQISHYSISTGGCHTARVSSEATMYHSIQAIS